MSGNRFARVLAPQLDEPAAVCESLGILREFCAGIEQSTQRRVQCLLQAGFQVNHGQEWRPLLRARGQEPEQVLLRAYVPPASWPVALDLHEAALTICRNAEELTAALSAYLAEPAVVEQIRHFIAMADDG